ncbi:MAG: ATP-binding protein [Candidatus Aquicultorales bacterium]
MKRRMPWWTVPLGGAGLLLGAWLWIERSVLPRPSTRELRRRMGVSWLTFLDSYIYLSKTALYLKTADLEFVAPRKTRVDAANGYHGKVVPLQGAKKLVRVDQPVPLTDLEQVIPYPRARKLLLESPQAVAALECPCRAQKKDPCKPTDVCMVVGEPFVSFVLDHQRDKARRLTTEEALEMLEAEERRGHIHTAWFKDSQDGRFYAICNCCDCCCLGMRSYKAGTPRLAHSGYRPVVDDTECTDCARCSDTCRFQAIPRGESAAHYDPAKCMGCGLCASHCPNEAISLALAPEKGIPLDVEVLA